MVDLDTKAQPGGIGDQPPVAPPPQRLGAHDADDLVRGVAEQTHQSLSEAIRGHVVRIDPKGRMAKRHVRRARAGPAEAAEVRFPAVADAGTGQPRLELPPRVSTPKTLDSRNTLRRSTKPVRGFEPASRTTRCVS